MLFRHGARSFSKTAIGEVQQVAASPDSRIDVLWGLSNFVIATIIAIGLIMLNLYNSYALITMLIGFWLGVLQFGLGIKMFLN